MKIRRILASLGAGVLISGALVALTAQEADAVTIGTFGPIVNNGSGKCLTVQPNANGYGDNGLRIVLATCNGSDVQAWSFWDSGRNCTSNCAYHEMYEIQNKYTGKCIDLNNGSSADQTPVQQWDCVDNTNMKWSFRPFNILSVGGIFKLVNERGGTCMDVQWGSHEDGAPLWGYHCFDDLNNGGQTYLHS
jgi:endoglucanase